MNFELNQQELQVIYQALSNAPWQVANPVIVSMQKQIDAHNAASKAAVETAPTA
jgi:hypothetical protein